MWLVLLLAVASFAWFVLRRADELAAVELSTDGARLVRGRAPPELLSDATEVAKRAAIATTVVRVVIEGGEPRLIAPAHLPDGVVQQLRNVVGRHRVVHFRTGRGVASRR